MSGISIRLVGGRRFAIAGVRSSRCGFVLRWSRPSSVFGGLRAWLGCARAVVLCLCSSLCDVLCSSVEQFVLFGFESLDCLVVFVGACCAESCSVVEETVTEFAWCHRSHRALRVRRICTQGLSAIMSPGVGAVGACGVFLAGGVVVSTSLCHCVCGDCVRIGRLCRRRRSSWCVLSVQAFVLVACVLRSACRSHPGCSGPRVRRGWCSAMPCVGDCRGKVGV